MFFKKLEKELEMQSSIGMQEPVRFEADSVKAFVNLNNGATAEVAIKVTFEYKGVRYNNHPIILIFIEKEGEEVLIKVDYTKVIQMVRCPAILWLLGIRNALLDLKPEGLLEQGIRQFLQEEARGAFKPSCKNTG